MYRLGLLEVREMAAVDLDLARLRHQIGERAACLLSHGCAARPDD